VISAAVLLLAMAVGSSYAYADLSLNRMGASATAIGLNASMPAVGWLLGTPLMPWALRRFNPRLVLLSLLGVAALALTGFPVLYDQDAWMGLRFLFGGGCGLVFRLIEYWINAASPDHHRARNLGIYNAAFCAGAALGAIALPGLGLDGWPPILLMLALTGGCAILLAVTRDAPPAIDVPPGQNWRSFTGFAFVAVLAALLVGMFEAVPYTLMPIYALRVGMGEAGAVATASAFLMGALLLNIPLGLLADRFGKVTVLSVACGVALLIPAVLPMTTTVPEALLALMVAWGGFGSAIYTISLALLADRFHGSALAGANAVFGTLYAFGNLIGPPLHGLAMDALDPQGLMVSSAALFLLFAGFLFRQSWSEWSRR